MSYLNVPSASSNTSINPPSLAVLRKLNTNGKYRPSTDFSSSVGEVGGGGFFQVCAPDMSRSTRGSGKASSGAAGLVSAPRSFCAIRSGGVSRKPPSEDGVVCFTCTLEAELRFTRAFTPAVLLRVAPQVRHHPERSVLDGALREQAVGGGGRMVRDQALESDRDPGVEEQRLLRVELRFETPHHGRQQGV